ncbi:MAG: hypothetical protein KME43_25205 [Myxacorys chilensis ATA2-1-KO14]|nr:hypothetical protein [Myxacorys chilensis ATA2-1-KO14]
MINPPVDAIDRRVDAINPPADAIDLTVGAPTPHHLLSLFASRKFPSPATALEIAAQSIALN